MNPIMIAKLATAAHKAGLDKYSLPMQIAPDFTNKVYDIADTILSDEDMKEIQGLSPEDLYKTLAKAYKGLKLLKINENKRVPTGEYGTVLRITDNGTFPEKRTLTRPQLRSGPDFENEYKGKMIAEDVINPVTGEVLYRPRTAITPEILKDMSDHEIEYVEIADQDNDNDNDNDNDDNTNVSGIASALLSHDLGRELEDEE